GKAPAVPRGRHPGPGGTVDVRGDGFPIARGTSPEPGSAGEREGRPRDGADATAVRLAAAPFDAGARSADGCPPNGRLVHVQLRSRTRRHDTRREHAQSPSTRRPVPDDRGQAREDPKRTTNSPS